MYNIVKTVHDRSHSRTTTTYGKYYEYNKYTLYVNIFKRHIVVSNKLSNYII